MLPLTVQLFVAMLAYGLNERVVRKADYLREENRALKEALQAATGKRHIPLIRIDPDGAWMLQVARNLLDPVDGFVRNATHLIHGRGGRCSNPEA